MRDADVTFSNKQALAVPSGADLGATDSTTKPNTRAHAPVGGFSVLVRVKNVDSTHPMTDGVLIVDCQVSIDGGSTWETNDSAKAEVAAAELAVGESVQRRITIGRDFYNEQNIAPGDLIDMKMVYSTSGHTFAQITDLQVTAYIDDGGPGIGS